MSRFRSGYRILSLFIIVAAIIALGITAKNREQAMVFGPGPLTAPATVVITRGGGTEAIGRRLEEAGVVDHWWAVPAAVQAFDLGRPLHAGEYAFAPGQSLHEVLEQMRAGRTVVHRLTVPEGLSVAEITALVDGEPALSGQIGSTPPEGSLMPDTYNFSLDDARADMIQRMRRAMDKTLGEFWAGRAPDLPLPSLHAALILASIVEKETAIAEERPKVAAVFLNRLKTGMRLQADPTVIYALTEGRGPLGRPLAHSDLAIDSPFNSYRYEGLPPTPIACPGRSAIHAVLHPDSSRVLYFVADGSGRHSFAETLGDHNRNVTRLRDLERAATGAGPR